MKKAILFLILSCIAVHAWIPMAVVPPKGTVSLGPLPTIAGDAMPSTATTAAIHRTPTALVFDIVCYEPQMAKIVTNAKTRDSQVWGDDCVELFIQPKGWNDYVHVVVNSIGTVFDELTKDVSWNAESITADSKKGNDRWTTSVTIPFDALGGVPKDGDEWRINVCRSRAVVPELSTWSPTIGGFHNPGAFGLIRFSNEPFPTAFAWDLQRRGEGKINLAWSSAKGVITTIDGKNLPADGSFSYSLVQHNKLYLESKINGTSIFRALLPIPVNPLVQLIHTAKSNLEGLSSPEATALSAEINALQELFDQTPPDKQAPFKEMLGNYVSKSRNLKVKADFMAKKHSANEIPYGVESSLVKLLKHSPFNGEIGGIAKLDAARNEMDAAQIVLFANDYTLLLTEAKIDGDLKSDDGKILPASALRLRRVGYVNTTKPVYKVEHVGLWPDPLMDLAPFDIAAGSFETIWLDVRVPNNQPAALYKGSVTVTAMNGSPTKVPVEIRVRNFTIPKKASITTAFGMGPNWRVPQDRAAYLDNLLEHRITPYTCVSAPKLISLPTLDWKNAQKLTVTVTPKRPAELQGMITLRDKPSANLPRHTLPAGKTTVIDFPKEQIAFENILSVKFTVVNTDTAELQAAVSFADGTVKTFLPAASHSAILADGWLQSWPTWQFEAWQQPDNPAIFDWTEFDEKFEAALAKGITSHIAPVRQPFSVWSAELQKHLSAKGWLQYFYTYMFDEPEPKDYPHVNSLLSQIKLPQPGKLKNMMTARSFPPELPFVDIWCPEVYSYNAELSVAEQKKDREVWWYVAFSTRHPFPNIWIDYPAIDCRIWPWLSWKHDIDGMLYWSITYWPKNPWMTGEMFPRANGDGSALYPGNDGKPVDSIRWECLRDGMEDYEVFCPLEAAARELGDKRPDLVATIKRLCAIDTSVATSFREYNFDPQPLLAARRQMSDCLEQAIAALGHEPTIQGRPRRRGGVTQEQVAEAMNNAPKQNKKSEQIDFTKLAFPKPQPQDGLRLYYRFDSDLPYLFDYSGNGFIGIPINAKRVANGDGKALQIMNKGYVTLPSGIDLLGPQPTEGTIEFMVRPDFDPLSLANTGSDKYACLFYLMETDGNGLPDGFDEIAVYIKNGNLQFHCGGFPAFAGGIPTPLREGQWHRVAIVWKPNDRRLYIDGKLLIHNTSAYPPSRLDAFHGTLGAHSPHHAFTFNGTFDNLKIWSRALQESELQ